MKYDTKKLRKNILKYSKFEIENEVWKPIKNFEKYYEVSNLGRYRNLDRVILKSNGVKQFSKSKFLKNNYYTNGYTQLTLVVDKKRYNFIGHRVIAEHFIPNPNNYPEVNHKNCIKWDNRVCNLEWVTHKQNIQHATISRDFSYMTGESSHTTKYTKKQVLKIRDMFSKGATRREIREKLNIPKSTIYYITSVKTWKDI